jgi:hypothetical protein
VEEEVGGSGFGVGVLGIVGECLSPARALGGVGWALLRP